MTVRLLDDATTARLRAQPLTVDLDDVARPPGRRGLRRLSRSRILERTDLDGLEADLLAWRVQERAGLEVRASDVPLVAGTVVVMRLGVGPLALRIPCRVLDVVTAPDHRGFTYGTLPGHPETGVETFELRRRPDGRVELVIEAVSAPATWPARAAGPIGRALQSAMTDRYLTALDRFGPSRRT